MAGSPVAIIKILEFDERTQHVRKRPPYRVVFARGGPMRMALADLLGNLSLYIRELAFQSEAIPAGFGHGRTAPAALDSEIGYKKGSKF